MSELHNRRVFVAGHRGMVGSAICRALERQGNNTVITRGRDELDLMDQGAVLSFFENTKIDSVFLAAAKVGGIQANSNYPADFIYQNLTIQGNVIEAAHQRSVHKLLFLGSSCIYPRLAIQPMAETALLAGALEPTNEPYAIAKIAGIKLCESYNRQYGRDYRSVMPTNLYGLGDNFHAENSHVIPGLIRRFHTAVSNQDKVITIWGSGLPLREFLHVDDMANACLHVMDLDIDTYHTACPATRSHINIGTGEDCAISELALLLAKISGFDGKIEFDVSKPDGAPRKLLDVSVINSLGWRHHIPLQTGLQMTWTWFRENLTELRLD